MVVLSHYSKENRPVTENQTSVQVVAIKPGMIRVGIDARISECIGLTDEIEQMEQKELSIQGVPGEVHPGLVKIRNLLQRRLNIAQRGLNEAKNLAATQPECASFLMARVQEDLGMLQSRIRSEVEKLCPLIPGKNRSFDAAANCS